MQGNPFFIPSAALAADENRARLSADLTGPGLTICLWLTVAALLGVAAMSFFNQLALLDASLSCAARV